MNARAIRPPGRRGGAGKRPGRSRPVRIKGGKGSSCVLLLVAVAFLSYVGAWAFHLLT